jgi:hypothetical protein
MVLDCEGLAKLIDDHERTVAMVSAARSRGMEVVINALTIVEATHRRSDQARLAWLLSGLRISPVGDKEAKAASALLVNTGLHGHKYAINAIVAEMAMRQRQPVILLTSDIDDMTKLCEGRVHLVTI